STELDQFMRTHGGRIDSMLVEASAAATQVNSILGKVDVLLDQVPETVTEATQLTKRVNALVGELADLDPLRAVEITKLILQKEGLTVNLRRRSEETIAEDIDLYRSVLGRQKPEQESQPKP